MTSAEAQAYCTDLTKQSGSNFYYSFMFLPKARREAMYTVYAFCKAVDSAVDEPPPGSDPKEELRRWRSELDLVYAGEPTWPLMISLAHHAKRLSIPKAYFEELIKGVEMDLATTRYRTFEELSLYCYRVASIVGLICLHIFGPTSAHAQDYAVDLGMAFQLTNILRDLAPMPNRAASTFPRKIWHNSAAVKRNSSSDKRSPRLHELVRFEAQRARGLLCKGPGCARFPAVEDRRALTVAEIMRAVYSPYPGTH